MPKIMLRWRCLFLNETHTNPEAALEELIDGIPTQIWEMTDERTYGYANAAHAAFWGKNRGEIERHDIYAFLPKDDADRSIQANRKAIETKQSVDSNEWITDATGIRRLYHVTRTPKLSGAGVVLCLCCTAQDIEQCHPYLAYDNAGVGSLHSNEQIEELVQARVHDVVDSIWGTVTSLVHLAESQDAATCGHLRRIMETCRVVASVLSFNSVYSGQLNYSFIYNLQQASLLHDIGKVGIPDSILLKPGKLTREEFEVMKQHTTIGAQTLEAAYPRFQDNSILKMAIDIALYHHERWDGKGYPKGLKGDDIPLSAQIVAICDVYDAIRSVRSYKPAYTHEESLSEIRRECGTHFNPGLCDAFFNCAEEIRHIYESYST